MAEKIHFSYECETVGTSITGEKRVKNKESFSYTESEMKGVKPEEKPWKVLDFKYYSAGKKYDAKLTSFSDTYALFSYANQEGKGFNSKVNSFLFFIDFAALSLERVVIAFPGGELERSQGKCKKLDT
jgi:hypothetical protein